MKPEGLTLATLAVLAFCFGAGIFIGYSLSTIQDRAIQRELARLTDCGVLGVARQAQRP